MKSPSDSLSFRPIVSSLNTYNYPLAKFLTNLLSPVINQNHCCKDSFTFCKEIKQVRTNNKFLVSFDVCSLFTNIPLEETIDIAVNEILKHKPYFKIFKKELIKLFKVATSQTHFMFDGEYYDQIDGVSMGSPLGPVLANLFMGYHESKWLSDYKTSEIVMYKRYVDDIFCIFNNENDAKNFFEYLNEQHINIKFTMEKEENSSLAFLDVLLTKNNHGFTSTVFRKKTSIGLFTSFDSFTPISYKIGLIKTLLNRAFVICSSWKILDKEINNIKTLLNKNLYPTTLVDKEIKVFLDKKFINKQIVSESDDNSLYYKLTYIGELSIYAKRKILQISKKFCKKTRIKLVFTPTKLGDCFSNKDPLPKDLKSFVVYKFICAGCNTCYVGETKRHLKTRISEHLGNDKNSHILKHLQENASCKQVCNKDCFTIIDNATSSFRLKIKEAIHIKWLKPDLNKQVNHVSMTITV